MKVAASPLRMTKRGDARRLYELMRSSHRKPSPQGEGAPKGRIGHQRYERAVKDKRNVSLSFEVFVKAPERRCALILIKSDTRKWYASHQSLISFHNISLLYLTKEFLWDKI